MESSAREGVDVVEVIDLANCMPGEFEMGQVSRLCGRAAADYIEKAVELAMEGAVSAIVTAPIHKESINLAGVDAPGHTEMLAETDPDQRVRHDARRRGSSRLPCHDARRPQGRSCPDQCPSASLR